ncbi:hypothetical [Yersinia pestis KIM10+]|uniref:Uncharacterized protein n=1 Tax=Yersinia pestis TaxID=632 RepID=Q8CLW1_YERPE|nr:hypothetical [Yersinia pestis KIM10+]
MQVKGLSYSRVAKTLNVISFMWVMLLTLICGSGKTAYPVFSTAVLAGQSLSRLSLMQWWIITKVGQSNTSSSLKN